MWPTAARTAGISAKRSARCFHHSSIALFSNGFRQCEALESVSGAHVGPVRVPFRKELKDQQKAQKLACTDTESADKAPKPRLEDWELTVGIEVHAQLNTERKLFSHAGTASSEDANAHAELFDLALPGSQPKFQHAVLLPALRAALALNCRINASSRFDRKHYFYQDQPAGYQITQYYEPFARDGYLSLDTSDGVPEDDNGGIVRVGIKQIQLEQDTAKTVQQPPNDMLLDFNRVGHPLIEIITLPHVHTPKTAAACVRKIQSILQSVSAMSTGMELGGLRADVNVSVLDKSTRDGAHSYHGVDGLGQRVEIKNLNSFKSVEDAVVAERNRQIETLLDGRPIVGETRAWSIGSTETRELRGKEGEVDYRYMPDPDILPLHINQELVDYVKSQLPMLPQEQIQFLVEKHKLSNKDAKTMVSLDGGRRLDYLEEVLSVIMGTGRTEEDFGLLASNWVLHELGGLLSSANMSFDANPVQPAALASILLELASEKITLKSAKKILVKVFEGDQRSICEIIDHDNFARRIVDMEAARTSAQQLVQSHPDMAAKAMAGQGGKFQWFVGQMIRQYGGNIDTGTVTAALKPFLGPGASRPHSKP